MDEGLYRYIRPFFTFIVKVLFRPVVLNKEYIPTDGSAIIAGNHRSGLDPCMIVIATKRTTHVLAKKELHQGLQGLFFRNVGTIPVDRNIKDKSASMLAEEVLLQGRLITLFPEGTRNKTNEVLLPFKFGAVSLAKKTNSKIIPFGITGEYKLFQKSIKIEFGEPIDISGFDLPEANQYLVERVKELVQNK